MRIKSAMNAIANAVRCVDANDRDIEKRAADITTPLPGLDATLTGLANEELQALALAARALSIRALAHERSRRMEALTPPRKIRGDATLTYIISGEAWYAGTLDAHDRASLTVGADTEPGGGYWEFDVTEVEFADWTIKLSIYAEAFEAFAEIPEFFEAMRVEQPARLADVRVILDRLGAVDVTPRQRT